MSKHFRPWKIDEAQLLPPSVQDYVPEDHLSRFIVALVRESLDLSEIEASYASVLGQPPFVPDFRTICDFRKRHLQALARLFVQVLELCAAAGLTKRGHVAFDGTEIKANASKHKAMSYERMKKREIELQ